MLPGKIKVQAACLGVEAEKEEGETRGVRVGGDGGGGGLL